MTSFLNYKNTEFTKRKVSLILQNTTHDQEDDDNSDINTDNFDKAQDDNVDDNDAAEYDGSPRSVFDPGCVVNGGQLDENEGHSETEPPEWEFGIHRSERAKSSRTEDLTLSDIILDPDGNVLYYWMGVVTVVVIYNIAVIVLRISFKEMREPAISDSVFYSLDTVGDLTFVVDVLVNMRVSYYEGGCLVLDPGRIIDRYTRSNKFLVDMLAVLPLGTFYSLLEGVNRFLPFVPIYYLTGLSGGFHILLVRTVRLLKYPTMVKFFDLTDSRTRNPNLVRAFKLTLNLWVVIHWIGCFYYMLSEYEGLGTNEWVYPAGDQYKPFFKKYIRIMYWSLMTLTTIGERPAPDTDVEFVFTGFTFLIGVFVFAAVVGNVGDVISNMNAARQDFQSRMDQIKFYMLHRGVDERLQNRVKRWADYAWTRTQVIDEPTLLQMLPDRLRTEIAINVHLETLKKVKIFEECEEGLLRELVLKLRPQVYSPGDYICRIGEVGREMYIVNHGKVEILIPHTHTGKKTIIATLTPGNYFGEISLLKLDEGQNRRTADVKARGYSELLRLSRKDLMSALVEYPNAKRILEQQAKERMQKTKEARRSSNSSETATPETVTEDQHPRKKSDALLKVIRSENFQKLVAARHTETNELKNVLTELKQFDSQRTKERLAVLTQENAELSAKLREKLQEIDRLKLKFSKHLRRCARTCASYVKNGDATPLRPFTIKYANRTESFRTCSRCADEGFIRNISPSVVYCQNQSRIPQRVRKLSSKILTETNNRNVRHEPARVTVPVSTNVEYCHDKTNLITIATPQNKQSLPGFSSESCDSQQSFKTEGDHSRSGCECTEPRAVLDCPKVIVQECSDDNSISHETTVDSSTLVSQEEVSEGLREIEQLLSLAPNSGFLSDYSATDSQSSDDDDESEINVID